MGLGIPPVKIKILLESSPLKSRILERRLAVSTARGRTLESTDGLNRRRPHVSRAHACDLRGTSDAHAHVGIRYTYSYADVYANAHVYMYDLQVRVRIIYSMRMPSKHTTRTLHL